MKPIDLLQFRKLLEQARCLLRVSRHDELAETIRQCPRSADTLSMLAELRFREGDLKHARELVDQALSLSPDHFEAMLLKGAMELFLGAEEDAAITLGRAVELYPCNYRVRYKLSQAYLRLSQTDLASEQVRESQRLRCLQVHFADLHAKASVDMDDADLRYQLGKVAEELDRPDLAMSWFAAAVALDASHIHAREALQAATAAGRDYPNHPNPTGTIEAVIHEE